MRRGDVVTVAWTGDYGKPRPAIVIQTNHLAADATDTVLVCQITSDLQTASIRRITVIPTPDNGLLRPSQIMVEKIFAAKREKCGAVIGVMDEATMDAWGCVDVCRGVDGVRFDIKQPSAPIAFPF